MDQATASTSSQRLNVRPSVLRIPSRLSRSARTTRRRLRLAKGLERAVERAGRPRTGLTAAVPVSREAFGEARPQLLDIVERLRGPHPVGRDGLELVRELLCDCASPLYVGAPGELRRAATDALRALDDDA